MKNRVTCPEPGKIPLRTERLAILEARIVARKRLSGGIHFDALYVYRCRAGHFHLTRRSEWKGVANKLAWSVPEELQEWALSKPSDGMT